MTGADSGTVGRLSALAVATAFAAGAAILLAVESQRALIVLLVAAVAIAFFVERLGRARSWLSGAAEHEETAGIAAVVCILFVCALFRDDHFTLFLVGRVLLASLACLGLHLQFGAAGVANFAGAAFFGVGGYTAAILSAHSRLPHVLALLSGGITSALIGSLLLLPLLRTRGHYAALVTIAFGLLFRTFAEVNDSLGGPQGLKLQSFKFLGWQFNDELALGPFRASFYANYVIAAAALFALGFILVRRLDRSWLGLALDAVRLDETAAAVFGFEVARWKILAFTLGNFLTGAAGALSAFMVGFIAPNNFTFAESLTFVSIVILGGIGNAWGVALAAFIMVVLPEKLQVIQEYRFLLYATLVILILRFRPAGLLPRPLRRYFRSLA
jgi:ABC-type branched-subunit amino acid transport system permease subunit